MEYILFLILLNLIVPCFFIYNECFFKNEIEINHVGLFTLGFVYYWITPIAMGLIGNEYTINESFESWHAYFAMINNENLIIYLSAIFFMYISFCSGSFLGQTSIKKMNIPNYLLAEHAVLKAYIFITMIILSFFVVKFRNDFFQGYQSELALSAGEKGPFVAATLMLLALVMIYTLLRESKFTRFKQIVFNKFFVLYFIAGLLVVSLGGRLYFVSSVIMLLVYKTIYFKRIRLSRMLLLVVAGLLFSALIGGLREGHLYVDWISILLNILAEPIFTSFSLMGFLADGKLELFNWPISLLSFASNLLPTQIFPDKKEWAVSLEDLGYLIFAPQGALNSFVSFTINFGMVGSVIVLFLFGFLMSRLKVSEKLSARVIYLMLSGMIPFTFFRDGFETSIIKNMFQFSVLIPLMIIVSIKLVYSILKYNQDESES